ncbi:MAG: hypothetical protein EXQ96_10285 [Alphaproteobacteria bacterium]|nr:hypothetical protein [Alphaproteobacteria bacterium]
MDITPLVPAGRQIIQGYGPGRFRVAGIIYQGSVIVLPEATRPWAVAAFAQVTLPALRDAFTADPAPEIALLGCGKGSAMLAAEVRDGLRALGLAVETMDTGAACRTFNVLLAEGRRVAAALIALA